MRLYGWASLALLVLPVGCQRDGAKKEAPAASVSGSVHHANMGAVERDGVKRAAGCGTVTVGGKSIPLACRREGWMTIKHAGKLLVARKELNAKSGFVGLAALPASVDHRKGNTEGPMREQGEVGACTAFSLAGAIDHAMAVSAGAPGNVSTLHIWSRYGTGYKEDATKQNLDHPIALEASWPWNGETACRYVDGGECSDVCPKASRCGDPDASARSKADAAGVATLTRVTSVDGNTDAFREVIAKGQDIWFGMAIDAPRFEKLAGKDATSPDFDARSSGDGHAMTAVGYTTDPVKGTFFLLKNSWSKEWGDQGYAWMHEATLMRNIDQAYVVEAKPALGVPTLPGAIPSAIPAIPSALPIPFPPPATSGSTPTKPAPSTPPPAASSDPSAIPWPSLPFPIALPAIPTTPGCASGRVPDALTGICEKVCSDGSAPFAGVCAAGGSCPPGFASILGICVVAPPDKSGLASDGVNYDCGMGGCVYTIPKGTLGCSTGKDCMHVCPAPKFLLAVASGKLTCSE